MSQLIANAQPQIILMQNEDRIQPVWWQPGEINVEWLWCNMGTYSYQNSWWPGPSGFWGDYDASVAVLDAISYDLPETTSGCASRFTVQGVTRDQYGSILANCTVKMYRTSDDSLVSVYISDANGVFYAQTPYYPDTHYLVAYKSGSPDVEGTTANNLIGA